MEAVKAEAAPKPALTVLLATAKGTPGDAARAAAERVRLYVQEKNPERAVEVLQAADEFVKTAGRWSGWTSWVAFAGAGRRYASREPVYHLVVSPQETVGRATADIFRIRLENGLPAAVLRPDGRVVRVVCTHVIDPKNWRAGWRLLPEAPSGPSEDEIPF